MLATLLGVQPIITLLIIERRLVLFASWFNTRSNRVGTGSFAKYFNHPTFLIGIVFALAALFCACLGAILQKGD